METINIIRGEHRSLAAVLHGMLFLVHQTRDRGTKPNFELFGAMIYYIDAFPERFHHPKEERYLFWMLRTRHPPSARLLDRLKVEHEAGAERIKTLEQALARYQQGGASEFPSFLAAVEAYAAFYWEHMLLEEKEVLPLAEKYLTVRDWEAIDSAFLAHRDPMSGADKESDGGEKFDALFTRILNLAPPPIGIGPEPNATPVRTR